MPTGWLAAIEQVIQNSPEPRACVATRLECASDQDALPPPEQTGKAAGRT